MTRHHRSPGSRYSHGFSLIELMISMTLGLLISVAAFSAYLGAASASKMADAQARMNEDAQAALTILTQQLRMAGNNPDQVSRIEDADPAKSSVRNPVYGPTTFSTSPGSFSTSNFIIRGCDGRFSNITTAAALDDLSCVADATQPDSIAVNYEADTFNTIPTITTPAPTDCLGNTLTTITAEVPTIASSPGTAPVTYSVIDNRFYIATPAAGGPSLYCQGNGGSSTAQALVENIEDMQFTYGTVKASTTDATVTTAPVAGYLDSNGVETNTVLDSGSPPNPPASLAGLPSSSARWARVVSVRICVLVRSANPVVTDLASARYRRCDGTLETAPPDTRLRRAYATTVVLRNQRL